MTEVAINNLFSQVNEAFKQQGDRLKELKVELDRLEERLNVQEQRSKAGTRGRKRLQQAKTNPEAPDKKVCGSSEAGRQNQND